MDKVVIKYTVILSLILGLILGLVAPVPIIGTLALFGLLLLAAPLVIVYLIMDGKPEISSPKDSIITGAIIGFVANISFAIVYSIITAVMSGLFHYSSNLFLTAMIVNSPIWLLLTFIIFLGILCGTTNAFTGFATYYSINLIRDIYEKNHPELKQNQDFTQEDYK